MRDIRLFYYMKSKKNFKNSVTKQQKMARIAKTLSWIG
ncbi:hypothetical protein RUMOBE_02956 [Blautia obeum ATCC 29174]|uniref:Uncharacterized protein n=1 Tax=Blautia obeum ATCC 29174 TaxID=411459 RepID=A5ZVC0_9FIRM|nr:hypothetical protein RUMOBE_02956 [Blautia obeum ATCC 29174]